MGEAHAQDPGTPFSRAVPLELIRESPTNPRRTFDQAALEELADSVRKHGILQPVLLRPDTGQGYELVAGARRFRAAQLAGLATIPATLRTLTDLEVLEIQVVENLQRAELHPLEEAEGYRLLHETHGYAADEIAAKVGKSRAYVYGRMKLCALAPAVAEMFRNGDLDASRALLIARIPVPELQVKAAADITEDWQPMSYREAAEYVQNEYMLRLAAAPFDTAAEDLVPGAGTCAACPKRTGNQSELFSDVSSADVCTDPKCFAEKKAAAQEKARAEAEARGQTVLTGADAKKAFASRSLVRLDDKNYESDPKHRTWRDLIRGRESDVPVTLAQAPDRIVELVSRKDAEAAAAAKGVKLRQPQSYRRTESASEKKHKVRKQVIAELVPDLVMKAEIFTDRAALARLVAESLLRGRADVLKQVAKRRGQKDLEKHAFGKLPKATARVLDGMSEQELWGLIVELIAMDDATSTWGRDYGVQWISACEMLGVDFRAKHKSIAAAGAVKRKAQAKGKAKAKRKAKAA